MSSPIGLPWPDYSGSPWKSAPFRPLVTIWVQRAACPLLQRFHSGPGPVNAQWLVVHLYANDNLVAYGYADWVTIVDYSASSVEFSKENPQGITQGDELKVLVGLYVNVGQLPLIESNYAYATNYALFSSVEICGY